MNINIHKNRFFCTDDYPGVHFGRNYRDSNAIHLRSVFRRAPAGLALKPSVAHRVHICAAPSWKNNKTK